MGEKGLSLGDERIIAEDLYQDGKKIGDHSVVCVYVHTVPAGETERRLTFHITH